jgi:hypothetical protein
MKYVFMTICLMCLLAGCGPTDGTTIDNSVQQAEKMQAMTEQLQILVATMAQAYRDANLLKPSDVEKVKDIQAAVDKAQEEFAKIILAIKAGTVVPPDTSFETTMQTIIAATQATAPWNKYAPMIILGASLILAIFRIFKKNQEIKTVAAKYTGMKRGVDEYKLKNPQVAAEIYTTIGKHFPSLKA